MKRALSFLEKCNRQIAKMIWNKLMLSKDNPYRFFERIAAVAVANINEKEKRIEVTLIGHRRNIYRNLDKK